jgi:hypothetical protein
MRVPLVALAGALVAISSNAHAQTAWGYYAPYTGPPAQSVPMRPPTREELFKQELLGVQIVSMIPSFFVSFFDAGAISGAIQVIGSNMVMQQFENRNLTPVETCSVGLGAILLVGLFADKICKDSFTPQRYATPVRRIARVPHHHAARVTIGIVQVGSIAAPVRTRLSAALPSGTEKAPGTMAKVGDPK